jgi:hypothetical protein
MEELTLTDLAEPKYELVPITIMGKQAYLRPLSFDLQIEMYKTFEERADTEASSDDMKIMLGATLCDKNGKLLFENTTDAVKVLGDIPDLMEAFSKVSEVNAFDVDAEVKD